MAKKTVKAEEKKLTAIEQNQIKYNEFIKSLDGKSMDELKEVEKTLIADIDANDKKVGNTTFPLPDGYPEFKANVQYFLNKQKVQWQYALGMLELYDALETPDKEMPYPILDLILMNLGQLTFEGADEWRKVKSMTEYIQPMSDAYSEVKAHTYLLAEEHSALLNKMGIEDPTASNPVK